MTFGATLLGRTQWDGLHNGAEPSQDHGSRRSLAETGPREHRPSVGQGGQLTHSVRMGQR